MQKASSSSVLVTTSVLLTDEQMRRVDALAAREKRSRAFVIRELVDKALDPKPEPRRAA